MALLSMTGFGRAASTIRDLHWQIELSSVNRRQLDTLITIPREYSAIEAHISKSLRERLSRGYVKCVVRIQPIDAASGAINVEEARRQIDEFRAVAQELGLQDDLKASALFEFLRDAGARELATSDSESLWTQVKPVLDVALADLVAMRRAEGDALEADLRRRLASLRDFLPAIGERAAVVVENHRNALLKRLAEAELPMGADDPALLREVALFADRCDISEELTRLESHLSQTQGLFSVTEPCGRKLDFLCQEIFREINTIGSKGNDLQLSGIVVQFKADLEAFREQVQNVE
jgi:uncharacterized protein (TIGR00255 family)